MAYIDCFLVPVPRANRAAYEELARVSAEVVKDHGALRVVECWLDESGPDASTYHGEGARLEPHAYGSFLGAAGAGEAETVVVSFIEWPDRATRDAGMAKVTSDPRMQFPGGPPTFDGRRLVAAGFVPMRTSPLRVPTASAMLSRHDELLLRDLRLQPPWLLWLYVALGLAASGIGLHAAGASLESVLAAGGGFMIALGAEKLVTRRIRRAAAAVAAAPAG